MSPEDLRICAQPHGLIPSWTPLRLTLVFTSILVHPWPDPSTLPESSEEWLEKSAHIELLLLSSMGPRLFLALLHVFLFNLFKFVTFFLLFACSLLNPQRASISCQLATTFNFSKKIVELIRMELYLSFTRSIISLLAHESFVINPVQSLYFASILQHWTVPAQQRPVSPPVA